MLGVDVWQAAGGVLGAAFIVVLTWAAKKLKKIETGTTQVARATNHTAADEPPLVERVRRIDDAVQVMTQRQQGFDARMTGVEGRLDLLLKRQLEDRTP